MSEAGPRASTRLGFAALALAAPSWLAGCELVAGVADHGAAAHLQCSAENRCSCEPFFADCNGDLADGCEVDLRSDAQHCGQCGHDCMFTACERSSCVPVVLAEPRISNELKGGLALDRPSQTLWYLSEDGVGHVGIDGQGGGLLPQTAGAHSLAYSAVTRQLFFGLSAGAGRLAGVVVSEQSPAAKLIEVPCTEELRGVAIDPAGEIFYLARCGAELADCPCPSGSAEDRWALYALQADLTALELHPPSAAPILSVPAALQIAVTTNAYYVVVRQANGSDSLIGASRSDAQSSLAIGATGEQRLRLLDGALSYAGPDAVHPYEYDLNRVDEAGQQVQPLLSRVRLLRTWVASGDALYYATLDGRLERAEPDGSSLRLLARSASLDALEADEPSLYLIDLTSQQLLRVRKPEP